MRAETVREALLPALGLALTLAYGSFVGWVYATRPQSLADVVRGRFVSWRRLVEGLQKFGSVGPGNRLTANLGFAEPAKRLP